jgi:hypothetical protein
VRAIYEPAHCFIVGCLEHTECFSLPQDVEFRFASTTTLIRCNIRWTLLDLLTRRSCVESTISQIQNFVAVFCELAAFSFHAFSPFHLLPMPLALNTSALALNFHLAKTPIVLLDNGLAAFCLRLPILAILSILQESSS